MGKCTGHRDTDTGWVSAHPSVLAIAVTPAPAQGYTSRVNTGDVTPGT